VTVAERPRMNDDPAFLRAKLDRVMEPHVRPLNELIVGWNQSGRMVPWADPDSGGTASRILFLHESPGPAAAAGHGSGVISPDNKDQTAKRFWRLSQLADLDRGSFINWNVVPWYVSATATVANPTEPSRCARTCRRGSSSGSWLIPEDR
jgi:uracil-DNA glycosylase